MVKRGLSSRERMLQALRRKEPDYVPCSFMIFAALQQRCKDQFEFVSRQLELGLDARVELPELPFRFHPDVKVKEGRQKRRKGGSILLKEYTTPKGKLAAKVRQTPDWPYGDHVPLFNDYLAPRSRKFLITEERDLESLVYLFAEPSEEDIIAFRQHAESLKRFASEKGLLVSGGWRSRGPEKGIDKDGGVMGADALMWLCGMENALLWVLEKPEIIQRLLEIVSDWNRKRMAIYLDEGVDLLVRRGWYEGTDLWSPALYRKFIFPYLKEEIEMVHGAGAKFGYIMTSGVMPLLDDFLELGIDVLIGVDPVQGKGTDLRILKEKLGGSVCLWGGVNGFLTIENGEKEEVQKAIQSAISILGPGGGFILSPVDNVTDASERARDNVRTMIETWQQAR